MDKSSILAIVACVVFYVGYERFLDTKYPDRHNYLTQQEVAEVDSTQTPVSQAQAVSTNQPGTNSAQVMTAESPDSGQKLALLSQKDLTFETDTSIYTFNQQLGGIQSIKLKDYENETHTDKMELLNQPLVVQPALHEMGSNQQYQNFYAERIGNTIKFSRVENQVLMTHEFIIPQSGYGAQIRLSFTNQGSNGVELVSHAYFKHLIEFSQNKDGFLPAIKYQRNTSVVSAQGGTDWFDTEQYCNDSDKMGPIFQQGPSEIDYFGYDYHYFLSGILPKSKRLSLKVYKEKVVPKASCMLVLEGKVEQGSLRPNGTTTMEFDAWFGPKDKEMVEAFSPALKGSIDYGFFTKISQALLWSLKLIFEGVKNWGLTIVLFTILLKMLFYPLTKNSVQSMTRMKKLQPQMNQIRDKYKDDPLMQRQEMMRFMSTHKVNPMKGCLPILAQFPVFFAFYKVLPSAIELRHTPFLWLGDLSVSDPFYIMPVVLTIAMFLQQKLTPTTGLDKAQERMMMLFPLMFGLMMFTLPAGLALYVLTNSVVSILQQQWLNKKFA